MANIVQGSIGCTKKPGISFPNPSIVLSQSQILVIYGSVYIDNRVVNNTDTHHFAGDNADLDSNFDEVYPVFPDDPDLNGLVYRAVDGGIAHVAKSRFNHVPSKGWFEFRDHRWRRCLQGIDIYFPELVVSKLQIMKRFYQDHIPESELKEKQLKQITSTIKKVGNKDIPHYTKHSSGIFYNSNPDFESKLDESNDLLGFDNGVYDFKTHTFRSGRPDDFVSKSVGYCYMVEDSAEFEEKVYSLLQDIQPNVDERHHLLIFLSLLIHGSNREEIFTVFAGTTRNGKSLLSDLIKLTLGEYYATVSSTMLTGEKPTSSAPQADMVALKGCRAVIASEPERGRAINSAFMKWITGNDEVVCRPLNSNTIVRYNPKYKLIVLCNKIPVMDSNDEAVWIRSRIIEFPTKFVDLPVHPHERPINKSLKDDIKTIQWRQAFMKILITFYKKYQVEGLVPTAKVLQKTAEYKESSTIVLQFVNDRIEDANKGDNIALSSIYQQFQEWHAQNVGGSYPGSSYVKDELTSLGWDVSKKVKVGTSSVLGVKQHTLPQATTMQPKKALILKFGYFQLQTNGSNKMFVTD
ncbi:hypothetical protein SmJEL517_g05945 [Synchytrium microbalum]|uniref:SF3 helicase domain-containing protein n=1 Tax=Synchytrium microbalum TaxID=1806994 RepID=A0A507BS49_9FUNG|nr:uncharacterized protein SmJEL517_g05945 [Synchytrium microbalum]TPX30502.1 hypothetical protein SmJEL517_g05945 [Synchytrium microbalum]